MTAWAITTQNDRITAAENTTGVSSIGGGSGASAEPSFPYEGANLVNRKITSSSGAGWYWTITSLGGAARDMTGATGNVLLVKGIVTDFNGLQVAAGYWVRIGSDGVNYDGFDCAGTDAKIPAFEAYPARGGLQVFALAPDEVGYAAPSPRSLGTANFASVNYIGIVAAFANSTAKSENVGADALDLFDGFTMTGGTAPDDPGDWINFVDHDEDDVNSYSGDVRTGGARRAEGGGVLALGAWNVGDGTTATRFAGTGDVKWVDGYFPAGWTGPRINLAAGQGVQTDDAIHTSSGTKTPVDTRSVYEVIDPGDGFLIRGSLINHAEMKLVAGATFSGSAQIETLTQGAGIIDGGTIRTTSEAGVATHVAPTFADILAGTRYVQNGAGHAIELTAASPSAFTLNANLDGGYGADGSNSAAILNTSGKTITITLPSGVPTPTHTDSGAGSETLFVASRTLEFTGLRNPSEVRVFDAASPTTEIGGQEDVTTGTYSIGIDAAAYPNVIYHILSLGYLNIRNTVAMSSDRSIPVQQQIDRQYENP